ncbi:unnamed protein product [Linum trigynum]|uniref:Uncharacterized protein n=1 Tax=Linum trigynum TaxID=586398 RepID=A0AAV2EUN8_9ROSI
MLSPFSHENPPCLPPLGPPLSPPPPPPKLPPPLSLPFASAFSFAFPFRRTRHKTSTAATRIKTTNPAALGAMILISLLRRRFHGDDFEPAANSNSKLSRREGARGRRQLRFSGSRRLRKSERRQLSTLTWMNGMLSPNLSMSKLPGFVLQGKLVKMMQAAALRCI